MFTTLLGGLPRPPLADGASAAAVLAAAVQAQVAAGLDLVSDTGFASHPGDPVRSWQALADLTDRPCKAVVPGPFTSGVAVGASLDADRDVLLGLAEAGCPLIEVAEPAAVGIGADADSRVRFRDLHLRLLDGLDRPGGPHLSLAITGGSADGAGAETILAAPYASLAVDLIDGPDNWRLVTAAPMERGIVCGALSPREGTDDGPEVLLWALGYAASRRGLDRVGLATASSLAGLPWDAATRKMERLVHAARLAVLPREERLAAIDPRAVDARSAALGRYEPRRARRQAGPATDRSDTDPPPT